MALHTYKFIEIIYFLYLLLDDTNIEYLEYNIVPQVTKYNKVLCIREYWDKPPPAMNQL